jgi:MFS family permease
MVLEMCKGSEIGKFTGLYYTFSMAAQIVTPVATGWLMHYVGYNVLFIYAAIFMAAAFFSMQFVKHGEAVIAK